MGNMSNYMVKDYSYSGTATPELPSVGSIPRPLFFVDYFIMFVGWKLKMK